MPLQVWGPSGQTKDMGTAHAIEGFLLANNWDYQTRTFKITPIPGQIQCTNSITSDKINVQGNSIFKTCIGIIRLKPNQEAYHVDIAIENCVLQLK